MILLQNGSVMRGTGAPPSQEHVLIDGECIAEVGRFPQPTEARVIDCTGLVVSSGFIDAHSHSDLQVLDNRREKALQGVTTEVVGNCGFSPYPARDFGRLRDFANGIFCGGDKWGWQSAADYFADVQRYVRLANVVSLVGHGTLRIAQVGYRLGAVPPDDMAKMEWLLEEALEQGAAGLSTGLMYFPGESAPFAELERMCRIVARHGKIYASHIRSYSSSILDAVDEQIALARCTGCKLQISHLQAIGRANWPKQAQALEKIEHAQDDGIEIGFDCYPYLAGSTVLTQLLPQSTLDGGIEKLLTRLTEPTARAVIAEETTARLAQRWSELFVSSVASKENRHLIGKSLDEIGAERRCDPIDAAIDLLCEERGDVNILQFNQSQENLRALLVHPLSNVVSDGFYVKGRPHPRLHGTFPYLLGEICRARGWIPLQEAIRKITDLPARRFGLMRRGRLERGYFADITVFDPGQIASAATYDNPEIPPQGIRYVFRNGRVVS